MRVSPGQQGGLTWTSWDKKLFPDHVAFLKGLHDRNLKVTLNTHPADGIRGYEDCYKAMCKAMGVDPATDFVSPLLSWIGSPLLTL